jgi:6-phosphogluconolactonase
MMAEIRTYPDALSLARAAARHFVNLAAEAIAVNGRFVVALSGGSTPGDLYALLATDEFASQVNWLRLHVFWGDERCVPPDCACSNYQTARESLLDHVPLLAQNIHRIQGELRPEEAAINYEATLRAFFADHGRKGPQAARFDLVLLGMGDDGHTASLFPGTAALREPARWVAAHYVDKLGAWRVTLTPLAINAAAQVTFVVSGANKAERLKDVLNGPYQPDNLPAQIIKPHNGHMLWLVDSAAAATL